MIAASFWESRVEGKNAWDKGKLGWKWRIGKRVIMTSYHFWLFIIMFPALLAIPLVLDFSYKLLGILISAYFSGLIIQDFGWFVVNPVFPLKDFNPKKVKWHVWTNIFGFKIPLTYILGVLIAIASYIFLWN